MVQEEYVVIVRGHNGRGKRQFAYSVDPRKKPNAESVLRDFRIDSQIDDERHWRLCTLTGHEIRWLTDYADRVLVLEPINNGNVLPKLGAPSPKLAAREQPTTSNGDLMSTTTRPPTIGRTKSTDNQSPERVLRNHRSESSSIISVTSTLKLPSLSTASSSSGSNMHSSYAKGAKRNTDKGIPGGLPKDISRGRNGKREYGTTKRRERSR